MGQDCWRFISACAGTLGRFEIAAGTRAPTREAEQGNDLTVLRTCRMVLNQCQSHRIDTAEFTKAL